MNPEVLTFQMTQKHHPVFKRWDSSGCYNPYGLFVFVSNTLFTWLLTPYI